MGLQSSRPTHVVASRKSKVLSNRKSKSKSSQATELEVEQELELDLEQERAQLRASYSLQIAEAEEALSTDLRQIIIKIQLAKMENGNNESVEQEQQQQQHQLPIAEGVVTSATDTLNANEQVLNVTLGAAGASAVSGAIGTAGSSTEAPKTNERQLVNNNILAGSVASASAAVKTLQLHDDAKVDVDVDNDESEIATASLLRRRRSSSAEGVEYCEVLESPPVDEMLSNGAQRTQGNSCCRSRSSKTMSLGAAAAAAVTTGAAGTGGGSSSSSGSSTSKRRCCKCKCRDAISGLRGMLQSSTSNSNSTKDKKETTAATSRSKTRNVADRRSTPPTTTTATTATGMGVGVATRRQRNSVAVAEPSQLAIWAAPANEHGDVIIRISSQPQPKFLMEQASSRGVASTAACAVCTSNNNNNSSTTTPVVTMGPNIRLVATTEPPTTTTTTANVLPLAIEQPRPQYGAGVTVHSQIDFMHCLVPDLERIINSNFYFGKMDRYEAERLLEGKPEGTFLLRDSAQEEFLFSVTFRKYGRSLHARIEQSGHKFSFDCHDPCVFSALTVTGLLEHYKDPSCVMFFEPCLTMPLHRRQTFSLQQLARATIVSNTTYDGINQLELPGRLKSYLKEYHYKQKLRVKPCDAHTPAPYYTNI
ncbi:uncharacterized protein LOC117779907 [Drosophila innubila]|uniref:uncharacterized protein LOC117779907 n=1 Tax=Drosophila innubila TaxID=198719 RepID=UPI00148C14B0|nr:uncharacterized protein LOC117779907 [Drosophila innubila]